MLRQMMPVERAYKPWREIQRAQADLNRLFGGLRLLPEPEFPAINIWTNADSALLAAEVPGVTPDDLDITIHRDTVTLRGNPQPEPLNERDVMQRQERPQGAFARNVILPFRVDAAKASAKFERGVVILTLPRPDDDKPQHIKITRS